jgi:hypothetical protein
MDYRRALCLVFTAFGLIGFRVPSHASDARNPGNSSNATGTTFFINNQPGSNCNDAGPHTATQPWCSFAPVNQRRVFSPGDQILLARGATWNEQLTLTGSGTTRQPITLGAYGTGANPSILRSQQTDDICVLLTDASHWRIEHLEVGNAGVGILLHYTGLFNEGITINDIYAHDNKGIWSRFSREFPVSGGTPDPFAASLNINLSSGILFNISSNLTFSSTQYVLKGIWVSDIRGAHNVDSVAFDAEVATVDGGDGHNAFQNVVLNGLILTNDDGHAGGDYQGAGLGCSDSLRLLGMMNVTLLDSILYDEAGCYTTYGTAGVILGRVQNVNFTNNIIFGVPSTGSPDETGIDLEFAESQVSLRGNLFAENAGPGVEILNIHQLDHTTALNLSGNSFLNNARVLSGAGSVWQLSAGSGYGAPSGAIKDSLYSESTGAFFVGNASGSIAQLNNISTSSFPNYAAEQFSITQGSNDWRYMYESAPSTWVDIPRYAPADYNGAWEVSPAQYVSAFALAPASCNVACDIGGVSRVWVAPRSGNVDIRGRVLKADAGGGTGVYAQINLVSGHDVTRLWPVSDAAQLIAGTDQLGYSTDASSVSVQAGDMIRFEVTANGANSYDTVSWTPSVAYVSPPRPIVPRGVGRLSGIALQPKRF